MAETCGKSVDLSEKTLRYCERHQRHDYSTNRYFHERGANTIVAKLKIQDAVTGTSNVSSYNKRMSKCTERLSGMNNLSLWRMCLFWRNVNSAATSSRAMNLDLECHQRESVRECPGLRLRATCHRTRNGESNAALWSTLHAIGSQRPTLLLSRYLSSVRLAGFIVSQETIVLGRWSHQSPAGLLVYFRIPLHIPSNTSFIFCFSQKIEGCGFFWRRDGLTYLSLLSNAKRIYFILLV